MNPIRTHPVAWRRLWRRVAAALCTALTCTATPAQLPPVSALLGTDKAQVRTEQVRAQLVVHAPQGIRPGQSFEAGLLLEHAPQWHTYWQNPGDSGLPTELDWSLPQGLEAGEIAWPLPRKFPIGSLANYGYEGRVLLPVTVQVAATATLAPRLTLQLKAQWLACRQECIPQDGQFSLEVPAATALSQHQLLFESTRKQIPRPLPSHEVAGQWRQGGITEITDEGRFVQVRVDGLPSNWRGQTLSLFPVSAHVVHNAAVQGRDWTQKWQGANWTARIPVSTERADSPQQMQWVLAIGPESQPSAPALQIQTPVRGIWPALAAAPAAGMTPALEQALAENAARGASTPASTPTTSLGLALLGALLGGLILNLMPCIFPVLAIKVLAFTRSDLGPAQHRASGIAYTLGTVGSFVLLGGLMLALRATGEQLGWGFQLQSPWMVIALAALFTLMGLNLVGLFEFGHVLPDRLASLQSRHPTLDAAVSGMLAVAIASPCTAPFMGASLGLAVALPAWQALPVFGAMGLGMALPYLAVSFWPALAHRLPRPGPWMQVFRQAMAFPMFATVIWLLWVLGLQTGNDGVALALGMLLSLAFLMWSLRQSGWARRALSLLALVLLAALGWQWQTLPEPGPPAPAASEASLARWQAWSPTRLQSLLDAGRPVFVEFTAAWCVTCQYNKKTVLADPSVLAALDRKGVVTLRADWTRRDETITRALNALGRNGVPVYALYAPGKPVQLLSELPTRAEIEAALGRL
jgi:thiol:disulfide interchange protein/DsbC/DsbD-like thiol-disulfide interchange protein